MNLKKWKAMGLSLERCLQAKERISPYLQPSPLMRSEAIEQVLGYKSPIYLKLDCELPTGSFKVRGALNVLLQLKPEVEKVVAFSRGNFAQAVAYGAAKLHKKAIIVMPQNAPRKKIEGTKSLGAQIVLCDETHENANLIVKELADKQGCYILEPFNSYETMAGQSTAATEILAANLKAKHFFCPVGGGGLLSGCAYFFKASKSDMAIYSVEPLGAHDFYQSFHEKRHITFEKTDTIADGLRATSVGPLNYPILMANVDKVLAVSEPRIIEAMRLLWQQHQMVIEPASAVSLAGFLEVCKELEGEVVIMISGKNVDAEAFQKWIGISQ